MKLGMINTCIELSQWQIHICIDELQCKTSVDYITMVKNVIYDMFLLYNLFFFQKLRLKCCYILFLLSKVNSHFTMFVDVYLFCLPYTVCLYCRW